MVGFEEFNIANDTTRCIRFSRCTKSTRTKSHMSLRRTIQQLKDYIYAFSIHFPKLSFPSEVKTALRTEKQKERKKK
jgi:hypothetical protein